MKKPLIVCYANWGLLSFFVILGLVTEPAWAEVNEAAWDPVKEAFFSNRTITETPLIEIEAPLGAENGAQVPVSVSVTSSLLDQDKPVRIILLVDANPIPIVGIYNFSPKIILPKISTRVRLDKDAYLRAIVEGADGRLWMAKKLIHAGGGCSGAVSTDETTQKDIGKIKLQITAPIKPQAPYICTMSLKHPMHTGLQFNNVTKTIQPAFYIQKIHVHDGKTSILHAELSVGTAENPYIRFTFYPKTGTSELVVEVEDNHGQQFTERAEVAHL